MSADFEDRGIAAWEYPLVIPYRVVTIPVGLAFRGLLVGGYAVSKQPLFETVSDLELAFTGPGGGFYSTSFTAGGAMGVGAGLTAVYGNVFSADSELKARGQWTTKSVAKMTLGWRTDPSGPHGWEFGAGYRSRPNTKYFGLGESSLESRESIFTQTLSWLGLERHWGLGGSKSFHVTTMFSSIENARAESETDRFDDLDVVFADDLPFGYGASSNGWSFSGALLHDTTDSDGRPTAGGFHRLEAEYFTSSDDANAAHWTYRIDLQQYIPLWHERRTLALRGVVVVQDNESTDPIHFQRLLTNDDPDLLRGYPDFRWRDEGIAVITAEYRWPVWAAREADSAGLDAYLFTDLGQVFDEFDNIGGSTLTKSYGGGFRLLKAGGNFSARIEFAWSEEGSQIRLRGDQVFQYLKGGLFHGRDQIPSR